MSRRLGISGLEFDEDDDDCLAGTTLGVQILRCLFKLIWVGNVSKHVLHSWCGLEATELLFSDLDLPLAELGVM